jgi:hypothetical protein
LLKTFPIQQRLMDLVRKLCLDLFAMAGFQVTLYGRFWVTAKDGGGVDAQAAPPEELPGAASRSEQREGQEHGHRFPEEQGDGRDE